MDSKNLGKAKSKFLADMSSEIQKSMKIILSHSDFLKQTNLSAVQGGYVDTIYTGAHKLSWIVNDILDFSQLELGTIDLQMIEFNLEYLINDILTNIMKGKKELSIKTYVNIEKDVPRNLVGDPTRLRQVLVNLLSHVFKYAPKGEIGVIVRNMDERSSGAGGSAKVDLQMILKDTGNGIPKNKLQLIFNLESQDEPSRAWEYGGTGLGLAMCKFIVEVMGGTIQAESEEGMGSAFILNLPFQKGTLLRERKVFPLTKGELVGKKAIIVDDNEIARKILKKCCDTMGIETILVTASPKEVLQELDHMMNEGGGPDLILCDIMMPEMDGYELVKKVRDKKNCSGIRTIAVTSAVHVGSARNAQEGGFHGFLPKPVFLDELAKVITTVLGDKRAEKTIVTRHMAEELKFQGTRVLIGGGPKKDQELIKECLKVMDCEMEFVAKGQDAVERSKEKIYDLCLLDYAIVKQGGIEIVRAIKDISRNIPIIAVLDAGMETYRSECLYAGVDDFVVKPIDMANLKRIIKRYGKS